MKKEVTMIAGIHLPREMNCDVTLKLCFDDVAIAIHDVATMI